MKKEIFKKKWYVLKIKNGYEKLIKKKIFILYKKNNDILGKILIFYKKNIKIIKGKKIFYKKNSLPGYLIINIYLNNKILYKIKNITGVSCFLNEKINKLPLSLSKKEVKKIIYKHKNYLNNDINLNFVLGENVKIIYGIFNGFNGNIEKILNNNVELSVIIFDRKILIKLKINQIEKI
ncbi:MAG: transcription termination/antitermination factor NusG [Candidatus Shikimatogenerans bostrichidophilus]|nr:MAG: transcription termination/antitermination factor NusG [Candidatus Shikimatogenerans bostrichidophilus]